MGVWHSIGQTAAESARLLLPVTCLGCGAIGEHLCEECSVWLAAAVPRRGMLLGQHRAVARWVYIGPGREVVLTTKQRGRRDGLPLWGNAINEAVAALPPVGARGRVAVAAPSRWWASRRRGVHLVHHAALAAAASGSSPIGAVHSPLQTNRLIGDQKLRSAAARALRSSEQFVVPDAHLLRGADVVVIDDVITTGATARAALRAVAEARPASLTFAAVAYVPRCNGRGATAP